MTRVMCCRFSDAQEREIEEREQREQREREAAKRQNAERGRGWARVRHVFTHVCHSPSSIEAC